MKNEKELRIGCFFVSLKDLYFGANKDRFIELSKRIGELIIFYMDGRVKDIFPKNVRFIKIEAPMGPPRLLRCLYIVLLKSTSVTSKVKELKVDALYTQSGFWEQNINFVVSKIAKRPLVVRLRADEWAVRRIDFLEMGTYRKIFLPIMKVYDFFQTFTLNHASHVISVCEFLRGKAIEYGVRRDKITTVYTGTNHDLFKPSRKRRKKGKFTLCCTARLVKSKGVEYLIDAVRGLDVDVLIVGDEERYAEKLKKIAPVNVRFLGYVNDEKVLEYINYSDVLVLPSLSEGLPRSVLEAMACGKPIIATRVSGTPEIGFKGWLVKPGNAKELRKAIMEAAKAPRKTLEKMGEINREIILRRFTWDAACREILRIIMDCRKSVPNNCRKLSNQTVF